MKRIFIYGGFDMFAIRIVYCLFIMMFTVSMFCYGDTITKCEMSRITVPLAEKDGKVTCAASFMYGTYAKSPQGINDMLKSDQLSSKFAEVPAESRRQYPEYMIMKYYEELGAGHADKAAELFAPGEGRNKKKTELEKSISALQTQLQQFKQIVFLDKSCFGPYVRISIFLREIPEPNSNRKGKGIPGALYLKLVDNQYVFTEEIGSNSLLDNVVSYYSGQTIMARKNVTLNPDTRGMKWVDYSVDANSSISYKLGNSSGTSDNDLRIYFNCEPVNVQLIAGQQHGGLSPMMQFFETAVTAYWLGDESEILSTWSEKSKPSVSASIEQLKTSGDWPKVRLSPFGNKTWIVALLPTAEASIVYYTWGSYILAVAIQGDGVKNSYSLVNMIHLSGGNKDIFRDELFRKAIFDSYMVK